MENKYFSIVMPTYNAALTLAEAIDSILLQKYPYFELIVIDDGSSDASFDLAKNKAKADQRVKVVKMPINSGAATAMNFGISKAKHDWIVIVDSDAVEPNDWLSTAHSIAVDSNKKPDVFGGGVTFLAPKKDYWKKVFYYFEQLSYPEQDLTFSRTKLYKEPPIAGANLFLSSAALKRYGYFDVSIRAGYDRLYLCKIIEQGAMVSYYTKLRIEHPLYGYKNIRSFLARNIFFMRWKNLYIKSIPVMDKTYRMGAAIMSVALLLFLVLPLVFGSELGLSLDFLLGLSAYISIMLRLTRIMPVQYAIGYCSLDIVKKIISTYLYVTKRQPKNLDWKNR